jgi:hypothetical protein
MKTKIFLFSFFIALISIVSCADDDTFDNIGGSVQPDKDKIQVFDTIMNIWGETVKVDSVYAKTIAGYLGRFVDPEYGEIKAGYLAQFYPSSGFARDSMPPNKKDIIDSIHLYVLYRSYVGDSLAPMEVTAYKLNGPLDKHYYTNVDPSRYYDKNSILGKATYTARDLNISDSLNTVNNYTGAFKMVTIPLPVELGQKFLEEYKQPDKGAFASPEKMLEFFPGVYLESTFGSGSILDVEETRILIFYDRQGTSSTGTDTIGSTAAVLRVTKEVIQLNSFTNTNDAALLAPSEDKMYLKTPAGVYSKVVIPIPEIVRTVGNRKFNNVKLTLNACPAEKREFVLPFPALGTYNLVHSTRPKLLLIEPDSVKSFFEDQRVANNKTSYFTTFSASSYAYTYENIANLVQNAVEKAPNKDLELFVIPVNVSYFSQSDYYNSYVVDYASAAYLAPSAVTLKKGGDNLKIQIIASDLEINQR